MNNLYYFTGTENSYEIFKKMASDLQLELVNIVTIIDEDKRV